MAFEPYLMNRKQNCFKAVPCYQQYPRLPKHDPNCTLDKYQTYFRDRWKALSVNPCDPECPKPKSLCPLVRECGQEGKGPLGIAKPKKKADLTNEKLKSSICIPNQFESHLTQYNKVYAWPYSHNHVDDCCKAECPCLERFPEPPEMDYECKGNFPCPPMEDCTTYKHFFYEKPTPCPPRRYNPENYDPCSCPLESATQYRLDYEHKDPVPNGPVMAKAIKRGMWSMDQLCKEFTDDTETKAEYYRKCQCVRAPIIQPGNLRCEGTFEDSTETCSQFPPKCREDVVCYPDWIRNDLWMKPETPLSECTTYKHFYKWKQPKPNPGPVSEIKSPDAIPFSSMNNMWYTCCDPEVDQRVPVEKRDMDPWPYVVTCPIKYQDNLQTDPCAPFRDETTYKYDYYAKKRCMPNKWYGPPKGYTPPILPFNDNTTNRCSYPAYTPEQYKCAKTDAGNPCGILWGPYKCPPEEDKCRPRFPPPYGHPLKPYACSCPCGQFDERSSYHRDFKFWTPEMVDMVNEENCREIGVPKGISLYRASYDDQVGKKAEIMPPPVSKGGRCMNPCTIRDLDSLYRLSFRDFYKALPRQRLEKYRGKPTIRTRRSRTGEDECEKQNESGVTFYQMPKGVTVEDTVEYLKREQKEKERMAYEQARRILINKDKPYV